MKLGLKPRPKLSSDVVDALIAKVRRHVGADYSGARTEDLIHHLSLLSEREASIDLGAWLRELAGADWDEALIKRLVPALTVGETYFRREPQAWEWMKRSHLTPLIQSRRTRAQRRLVLWSAACCTGEEAYGLLFLIDEILGAEASEWEIEFIASDLNPEFISRAMGAVYGPGAFRCAEAAFRDRYFEPADRGRWRVAARWRSRIRFLRWNLVESSLPVLPESCDLLLCRNVLMYFGQGEAEAALRRLHSALSADGVLMLAAVEAGLATRAGFHGYWAGENYALGRHVSERRGPDASAREGKSQPLHEQGRFLRQAVKRPKASVGPAERASALTLRTINEQLRHAHALRQRGAHQQAQQILRVGLQRADLGKEDKFTACVLMARSYADTHDFDQACAWLAEASALDTGSVEAYLLEALIKQHQGHSRAALAAVHKALYLEPNAAMAHFLHADLLRNAGKSDAAIRALKRCLEALLSMPLEAEVSHGDGLSVAKLARMCEHLMEAIDA